MIKYTHSLFILLCFVLCIDLGCSDQNNDSDSVQSLDMIIPSPIQDFQQDLTLTFEPKDQIIENILEPDMIYDQEIEDATQPQEQDRM